MPGHESARTSGLYDRRNDSVALDEVERIAYIKGGAIIDHETPDKRRFVAVPK